MTHSPKASDALERGDWHEIALIFVQETDPMDIVTSCISSGSLLTIVYPLIITILKLCR